MQGAGGKRGQSSTASTEGPAQTGSILEGGTTRGQGVLQDTESAQKIYKQSERRQNREHQSSHLPVSSHCCSWAFTGLASPIIPVRQGWQCRDQGAHNSWHEGSSLPGFVERLDDPSPSEQCVPAPELWGHRLLVPCQPWLLGISLARTAPLSFLPSTGYVSLRGL